MAKKADETSIEKGIGMSSPYLSKPIRDLDEAEAEIRKFRVAFHGKDTELASVRKFGRLSRLVFEVPEGD